MLGDDLTPFFGAFAQTVVAGAVTGKGILDAPTDPMADGMILSDEYSLMTPTAQFGALTKGASITVGGVSFTVREVRKVDDGKLCTISLSKV